MLSPEASHTLRSDGSDTFSAAPHLMDVVKHRGSWGISHTRVPTESRPGHVALIAGMYEDVSAVTKGWKLNPVDFDSLFNVSHHAYTFGSPDILPMFAKGASPDKVDMWMYDESAEDFTKDASQLDLWVLDQVEQLFSRGKSDPQLDTQLRRPGIVFFLHLLGLDTTGHTFRPQSQEYIANLIVVDRIVKRVEALFQDFYAKDNDRTAFVFSADHGMSSKGNHGDGEPENTRTPLVAWGAGVQGPRRLTWEQDADELNWRDQEAEDDRNRLGARSIMQRINARGDPMSSDDTHQKSVEGYFDNWTGVERLARRDVEQADVTTLMATLLGLNLPANSEGKLPLSYLDMPPEETARAMLTNALEVLEIYRVKHLHRAKRMIKYVPFKGLSTEGDDQLLPGEDRVRRIRNHINSKEYDMAIEESSLLIDLALQGSSYLQTYDWLSLVSVVVMGYLGSILYGIAFLLQNFVLPDGQAINTSSSSAITLGKVIAAPVPGIIFTKFQLEEAPVTYYLYVLFTVLYWVRVIDSRRVYTHALRHYSSSTLYRNLFILLLFTLCTLQLIVHGYLHRYTWTLGFFALGFISPMLTFNSAQRSKNEGLIFLWGLNCVLCGLFTLSSVEKEDSRLLLFLSGGVFLLAALVVLKKKEWFLSPAECRQDTLQRTVKTIKVQMGLIVIATVVTIDSSRRLERKLGLPVLNQAVAWAVLILAPVVAFGLGFSSKKNISQTNLGQEDKDVSTRTEGPEVKTVSASIAGQPAGHRLTLIIFSCAPIFILLSLRDEALFFASYTSMLLTWSKMEGAMLEERTLDARSDSSSTPRKMALPRRIGLSECRLSILFLFMLHVGFFGTGNIASISSFYLSPVYRLVPVFSPFLMAALLILKILLPFVVLCSVFKFLAVGKPSGRVTGDFLPGDEPTLSPSSGKKPSRLALELNGAPILGPHSISGLGLSSQDIYGLVLIASISCDILSLNFLFAVRTTGAWLEIGQSITHFVMSNVLCVFMVVLTVVVDLLY
ncbi:unnamed protein product [Sympodiomycopsis kandeliae]